MTRSREIKLDNISRRVKNLSKLPFVTCGGSNAPLLRVACQNLNKKKEKKNEGKQQAARMTSENTDITIEDATFKSFVWQHFGYPTDIIDCSRVTDKTRTICKHCMKIMPYTAAI